MKFLTRLRLGFSHLNDHRFRHNFQECINPLCSCSLEAENTSHYLQHCHHFSQNLKNLTNSVNSIFEDFLSDNVKTNVVLYGDPRLDGESNKFILEATISYIKSSERFTGSIFDKNYIFYETGGRSKNLISFLTNHFLYKISAKVL